MELFEAFSSLSCELRIITAKNIEIKPKRNLFVRCYLSAGKNQRVKLDTQEISPNSFFWNESFSLDCFAMSKDSLKMLMQGTIVFELRSRSVVPTVFGRKSQLLGRAEVAWKTVIESRNMEIEKWVMMVPKKGGVNNEGLMMKPPSIQIGMKIEADHHPVAAEEAARKRMRRRRRRNGGWNDHECECSSCNGGCESCQDFEVLALGFALEAF